MVRFTLYVLKLFFILFAIIGIPMDYFCEKKTGKNCFFGIPAQHKGR